MDIKLHKQATTTPKIRAEIQAAPSGITDSELARQYGVATATIRRWRYRDDVHDRSHTRHNLLATLTPEQEEVLIAAREFLRLGLDDLLVVAREFLNSRLSRSGLHRMLQRRDVPALAELARQDVGDDEKPRHKPFRDYEPGYVHIDIKHLPQMPDKEQKTLPVRRHRSRHALGVSGDPKQSVRERCLRVHEAGGREGALQDPDGAD